MKVWTIQARDKSGNLLWDIIVKADTLREAIAIAQQQAPIQP